MSFLSREFYEYGDVFSVETIRGASLSDTIGVRFESGWIHVKLIFLQFYMGQMVSNLTAVESM